jgi:hypothetical protein
MDIGVKWYEEVSSYMESVFFTKITDNLATYADKMALRIQRDINSHMDSFFAGLADMIKPGLEDIPHQLSPTGVTWPVLSEHYFNWKNSTEAHNTRGAAQSNMFMLRELPKIVRIAPGRKTSKSKRARRTRVYSDSQLRKSPSLRDEIRRLGNPAQYYGPVTVFIESHTHISPGGHRLYKAGTFRDGIMNSRNGGFDLKSDRISKKSDYVTITVDWMPALMGVSLQERGVPEQPSTHAHARSAGMDEGPEQDALASLAKSVKDLPETVTNRLLNREHAYRPLLGPYMVYYQNSVVRNIIRNATSRFGAI